MLAAVQEQLLGSLLPALEQALREPRKASSSRGGWSSASAMR
jgi:hypothetical protein